MTSNTQASHHFPSHKHVTKPAMDSCGRSFLSRVTLSSREAPEAEQKPTLTFLFEMGTNETAFLYQELWGSLKAALSSLHLPWCLWWLIMDQVASLWSHRVSAAIMSKPSPFTTSTHKSSPIWVSHSWLKPVAVTKVVECYWCKWKLFICHGARKTIHILG